MHKLDLHAVQLGKYGGRESIFLVFEASYVAPDPGAVLGNQSVPPASKDAESSSLKHLMSRARGNEE